MPQAVFTQKLNYATFELHSVKKAEPFVQSAFQTEPDPAVLTPSVSPVAVSTAQS